MKFRIESIPPSEVAYIRKIGAYGKDNLETMNTLKKWSKDKGVLKGSIIFARIHDNPMITPPENCRYDACIVIDEDYKIESASIKKDLIQGGKYTVLEIQHTAVAVQKAWHYIFKAIASKKIDYDQSKPILERYKDALVKENKCEICVPVKWFLKPKLQLGGKEKEWIGKSLRKGLIIDVKSWESNPIGLYR